MLLHNENKLDDMGKILAHCMKLVPTLEAEGHLQLPYSSILDFDDTCFFSVLFGGDQLTVARIRGTQALRDTQDRRVDPFEGLLPVVEDWYSRMTLMKVREVFKLTLHCVSVYLIHVCTMFSCSMYHLHFYR